MKTTLPVRFRSSRTENMPAAASRLPAGMLLLVLIFSGSSTSCFFSKKPRPAQITVPPPPEPDTRPAVLPQPPNLPAQEQPRPSLAQDQPETPPPPAEPTPRRARRAHVQPPATTPPQTAETPPPVAADPPAPRLGQMLSPEQQRDYTNAINTSVARARQNVGYLRAHSLTEDQKAVVAQIEAFLTQVDEARKYDLVAARSLAERADVLAGDLAKAVR